MTDRGEEALPRRQVALIDLLDRLLSGGAVLTGDLVLSIADVDLVRISLRAVVVAVREDARWSFGPPLPEAVRRGEEPYDDRPPG
ncbi:hypothetical protein ACVW0K_001009 [Streptomyces filamentosus]|uniref:gas vesicle protein n=1 Tax=Streptomyces filamentosus TaxID=67294 RepID=UPI0036ED2223